MPHLNTVPYCLRMAAIFVALLLPLRGRAQTLITSDSLLNTGSPITTTYNAPGTSGQNGLVNLATDATKNLWLMYDNPWGVTTGSGTITQTYSGSGSITTSISLSGLPAGGVDGSPFVLLGCDQYSDCFGAGQPLQFPKQLSAMSSLVIDMNYALSGTLTGSRNMDVIFDDWVCNSNHPTGIPDCLEIIFTPYYNFPGNPGSLIRTINIPVILNGSASTWSFDEYSGGTNPDNALVIPHTRPGATSATVRFDMLPMMQQVVTDFGNPAYQWLTGVELGSEFGGSSSQSYTFTLNKLGVEQTLAGSPPAGSPPAPPTNLTGVVK